MDERSHAAIADEESFEAIEQAVMETARGRWFLAEFASRNRQADTASLLKSITRLERVIARSEPLEERFASRAKLARLIDDLDMLVATLVGEGTKPADGSQKLTDCVMLGEKTAIEMAVVADAARDLIGKFTEFPGTDDLFPELDHQLSELVRLASDQMVTMRRFEALAEIQRHVRGRLSDLVQAPLPEITMDATVGAPANDHFPEL
jgi:hypothetical protein